jgi:hypothetical protein
MSTSYKKFTPIKSVSRSKESIAAENAKYEAEMKRYQANAAFLAKVAEGEAASHKARFEEAQAEKAAQKFPFHGRTFDPNPQLLPPSWTYSNGGW